MWDDEALDKGDSNRDEEVMDFKYTLARLVDGWDIRNYEDRVVKGVPKI